jgi:hypothetical protein
MNLLISAASILIGSRAAMIKGGGIALQILF